jgi:predicted ATPase
MGLIDTALGMVDSMGERWFEAELRRLQGEWFVAHRADERQRAEACFHRALAVAREQEARTWELRAATSLARLWNDHGKRDEALDFLTPVYGVITEGFSTPELRDASALLNELRD